MTDDLLEPSGPQRSLRHHAQPSSQYQVAPEARPTRVRRRADGTLVGEVPVVPVSPQAPRERPRPSIHIAFNADKPDPPSRAHLAVRDCEGYDLRPNPLDAATPSEFVEAMRRYHRWAGKPSFRAMADRAPGSPATFCSMLKGDELPRFPMLSAFIVACGGTEDEFQRWATAWRKIDQSMDGDCSLPSVTLVSLPEPVPEKEQET